MERRGILPVSADSRFFTAGGAVTHRHEKERFRPLFSKLGDALDKLPAAAQSLLQKEIFAGSLYYAAIKGKYPHEGRMLNEYTSGVVIR